MKRKYICSNPSPKKTWLKYYKFKNQMLNSIISNKIFPFSKPKMSELCQAQQNSYKKENAVLICIIV